jgi:hypothetical protein
MSNAKIWEKKEYWLAYSWFWNSESGRGERVSVK